MHTLTDVVVVNPGSYPLGDQVHYSCKNADIVSKGKTWPVPVCFDDPPDAAVVLNHEPRSKEGPHTYIIHNTQTQIRAISLLCFTCLSSAGWPCVEERVVAILTKHAATLRMVYIIHA